MRSFADLMAKSSGLSDFAGNTTMLGGRSFPTFFQMEPVRPKHTILTSMSVG